jgi:hypothetical protein
LRFTSAICKLRAIAVRARLSIATCARGVDGLLDRSAQQLGRVANLLAERLGLLLVELGMQVGFE